MLPYTSRARTSDTRESYDLARSCTYDLLSVVVHVGEIDTGEFSIETPRGGASSILCCVHLT